MLDKLIFLILKNIVKYNWVIYKVIIGFMKNIEYCEYDV